MKYLLTSLILFFPILTTQAIDRPIEIIPVENISGTETEFNIRVAAIIGGVDDDTAYRIAYCESRLDPKAKNPNSTASGLFQFTNPTWKYIKAEGHQFDEAESIKQFIKWYKIKPEWWVCQ